MYIAMFGNVYGKISPAGQHSDESGTPPASPHCHGPIVAPPDYRFLPHAGDIWMEAWERERVAMIDKRRRVCDRLLENNNDIARAKIRLGRMCSCSTTRCGKLRLTPGRKTRTKNIV